MPDRRREGVVEVSSGDWLSKRPQPAELTFDPTWLLEAVQERLAAIAEEPDSYHTETVLGLFGRRYPELDATSHRLPASKQPNRSQARALEKTLGSRTHFVWGPPGTGKTRMLGAAVAELAERGRVLVATTTNGALDEAADRVAGVLGPAAIRSQCGIEC